MHVWQTIEGIKIGRARMLDAHFEGRLPIAWTCDWDVEKIPNIGKVLKAKLKGAWGGTDGT